MSDYMSIREAGARLRLLQHHHQCNQNGLNGSGDIKRKAEESERNIQKEVERIRALLLAQHKGNDAAIAIINEMFRLTIWDDDIHPYSDSYDGPGARVNKIVRDGAYHNI